MKKPPASKKPKIQLGPKALAEDQNSAVKPPHGGVEGVIQMFKVLDGNDAKRLLEEVRKRDPALAQNIQENLFAFEDIFEIDDKNLGLVFRAIPLKEWSNALRDPDPTWLPRLKEVLPKRTYEELTDLVDHLSPIKRKDLDAARTAIARRAKELEAEGKLLLRKSTGDSLEFID